MKKESDVKMQIGVDLGGSHIGVGIVNENGKIVIKKEQDLIISKENIDMKLYIRDTIISLINGALREIGAPICLIEKIGVASPGKVENGEIKDIYNLGIKELDLAQMLKEYYGVDVRIKNDAKCAGIAEKEYGALKNEKDAVFLCLGTGIGGATFYNGKLVEPTRQAGAEYGHMIIQKDGIECNCGNKGCFERYASMRAFKENMKVVLKLDSDVTSKQLLKEVSRQLDKKEVNECIDNYIDYLLLGLSNIVNIIEPEVICLGGGFVYFEKILYTRLIEKINLNKYKFNKPRIVLAQLGNDAGIIGATLI